MPPYPAGVSLRAVVCVALGAHVGDPTVVSGAAAVVAVINAWVPPVAGAVWTGLLFVLVALVHLGHVVVMAGRHRCWHAGHVLMAAGMVVMFWPAGSMLVSAPVGMGIYAAATATLALGVVLAKARGARVGVLWLVSVVDLAAMVYMFAMTSHRLLWLSVTAAVWFGAQAVGWAGGWLGGVLERGGLGEPVPATHAGSAPAAAEVSGSGAAEQVRTRYGASESPPAAPAGGSGAGSGAATATLTGTAVVTVVRRGVSRVVDGGPRDWSVRVSLTVMAVGMSYMLLAMQFGMTAMPAMPPAMGGMAGT